MYFINKHVYPGKLLKSNGLINTKSRWRLWGMEHVWNGKTDRALKQAQVIRQVSTELNLKKPCIVQRWIHVKNRIWIKSIVCIWKNKKRKKNYCQMWREKLQTIVWNGCHWVSIDNNLNANAVTLKQN